MRKKNKNFVSYVITLYNKKNYLSSVVKALAKEGGNHEREYIFVDDGSNDSSLFILNKLKIKLPGETKIISQRNMGASYSTNRAVKSAKGYWLRLLDGDDIIAYKSTSNMLSIARKKKEEFVYGLIYGEKRDSEIKIDSNCRIQSKNEGLEKFIKNCPGNSSCILVSKNRYLNSGGCDNRFVSPDQVLFLRLFKSGNGVFFDRNVAKMPKKKSNKSLSSQIRRSRYESILALIRLCEESDGVEMKFKKKAFRRSLSRANTYNKFLNKKIFSTILLMYLISKFFFPKNYIDWMYRSLVVFTQQSKEKPRDWLTGFDKKKIYKKQVSLK